MICASVPLHEVIAHIDETVGTHAAAPVSIRFEHLWLPHDANDAHDAHDANDAHDAHDANDAHDTFDSDEGDPTEVVHLLSLRRAA